MDQLVLLRRFVMVFRQQAAWAVLVAGCIACSGCNLNPRPEDPGFGEDPQGGLFGDDEGSAQSPPSGGAGGTDQGGPIDPTDPLGPPWFNEGTGVGGAMAQDAGTGVEVVVGNEDVADAGGDAASDAAPEASPGLNGPAVLAMDAGG